MGTKFISVFHGDRKTHSLKLLSIVLSLRSGLFLTELIGGLWVHSLSLLAVSGHMLVDIIAIAVAIFASWLAESSFKSETSLLPQQIEARAAFVNSLILIGMAVVIGWGVLQNYQTPAPFAGLPMLAIAVLGLAVKGINASLLYEQSRHNLNVRGVFFHAIADVGASFSLLVAALTFFYLNWLWADTAASLLVVVFMLVSAVSLLKDSLQTFN